MEIRFIRREFYKHQHFTFIGLGTMVLGVRPTKHKPETRKFGNLSPKGSYMTEETLKLVGEHCRQVQQADKQKHFSEYLSSLHWPGNTQAPAGVDFYNNFTTQTSHTTFCCWISFLTESLLMKPANWSKLIRVQNNKINNKRK